MNQALVQIQQGITAIETDIYAAALQAELQTYENNKSVIVANFTSLVTAMQSLSSSDPTTVQQALSTIDALRTITNLNAVIEAVYNIHTLLVGDASVSYQSLVSYHIQGTTLAIDAYWTAAQDATFQVAGLSAPGPSFQHGQGTPSQLPNPNNVPYPSTLLEDSFKVVTTTPASVLSGHISQAVVPTYTAMLRTQTQGLFFIYLALAGTVEASQLATFASYVQAEAQAMHSFFDYFGRDDYGSFMLQQLASHGRKILQPSDLTSYYPYDSSGDCANQSWPYGSGWMSFDGANVGTTRTALLLPSGPSLVTLSKKGVWTGCGHAANYVKPFVFGWSWSGKQDVTLPKASSYALPVAAPLRDALLGKLLEAPPSTAPVVKFWAEKAPFGTLWKANMQVRYAVTFVTPTGETDFGPGQPWGGAGLALAYLVNIPTDPSGQATRRSIYRQFEGGPPILIGTLPNNTGTAYQDDNS